jgi:hypothetical protein
VDKTAQIFGHFRNSFFAKHPLKVCEKVLASKRQKSDKNGGGKAVRTLRRRGVCETTALKPFLPFIHLI